MLNQGSDGEFVSDVARVNLPTQRQEKTTIS